MNDSVKFIFKTLIKVPVLILITYLIFNIFAFTFTYFRIMGLSYVVMQTAVENNYIPQVEKGTLLNYLKTLETGVVNNLAIGCNTSGGAADDDASNIDRGGSKNVRTQYGSPITVSVSANYNWIFPLVNTSKDQQIKDTDGNLVEKNDNTNANGLIYNENKNNNIKITYTVPGLKYYPDLS